MKILILTNHSYMFWRFRRELTEELLKRAEVVISTPFVGHEDDLQKLGCRCIETELERRGMNPVKELALLRYYKRLIRQENPDLVLTYSIKPNIYGGMACRQLGVPYAVNVQGLGSAFEKESLANFVSILYRAALKKARVVFFENNGNAQIFKDRRILTDERICVLSGAGINLADYPVQPYPGEEDGIRFLYIGRIMHEKGMDELFEAEKKLKERFGDKVHFDLVGFFEDDYRYTVDELVKENVVRFHGFQADPRPYYAACHCLVLPSYHEGMSNVLLEAAASGRALITTDIPGCREAVAEGENGYLIPPRDTEALYTAMQAFLELPEAERREMGRRGREKMVEEFDKQQVVQQTLAALQL